MVKVEVLLVKKCSNVKDGQVCEALDVSNYF